MPVGYTETMGALLHKSFIDYRKWIAVWSFLIGFLFKYNYLSVVIYQVPFITGLVIKNIILFLVLYLYALPLYENRKFRNLAFGFLCVFTFFCLSNIWYNRYFGNYLSLSDMVMGQGFRPVKVIARQLFKVQDIFFVLDLLLIFIFVLRDRFSIPVNKIYARCFTLRKNVIGAVLVCLVSAQILMTNYVLGNKAPMALFARSTSAFVNVYGIVPLYFFEYYSFYYPYEHRVPGIAPPSEKDVRVDKKIMKKDTGIHNIIVIQVESLDQNIIDHKHNGREITPFLNRLKKNALYFDNFYAQHVNGSFDAEFSFLTSIYPINKNYGFRVNDLSTFTSLVNILNQKGYATLAFHGNDKAFFHRGKAYSELGFDRFYSMEDFSFHDTVMDVGKTVFGINDYDFFLQSIAPLKSADSPFFAFFITVTSHTPYDFYPREYGEGTFEDIKNPLTRDYFRSISFVDKSLEMFFKNLADLDLVDNTLFVIYADHDSGVEGEEYSGKKKFVLQKPVKPPEHIPLFIIHPDIKPGVVSREATHADLAPTILGMLGEKEKPKEFFGKSMLQKDDAPVLFVHETPQILYKGQLFALMPLGIEKIGYVEEQGEKEMILPMDKELSDTIKYIQAMILDRRSDSL
ncbi:MAG: LTA synthase family protein [Desulfotignum sp.]